MGWRNPNDVTEFEVQAEAYVRLKAKFKYVRGEYHYSSGGRRARFDIAILDAHGNVLLVIEVKAKVSKREQAQGYRYGAMTGKPVLYIRGMAQAHAAVGIVCAYLADTSLGKQYLEAA